MLSARESLEGAALADSLGAELASIRSDEHGRRARESSTRNAAPRREQGRAWKRGLRIHGVRSPRRASAPPRSSTASALSRAPDLASRSCPLRAAEDPRFARAVASDGPGSRPVPRGSASTSGWLADAPQAGARPRTRGSTRPPTRSIRRTRAPVRIHDTAQIDRPRVPLLKEELDAPDDPGARFHAVGALRTRSPRRLGCSDPGLHFVRPAWALSCGCKSRRKETILIEASRNCGRATDRGEEAGSETAGRCTRTAFEATPSGTSGQRTAKLRWSRLRRRRRGGRAGKDSVLTWGDLASRSKERRVSGARSQPRS